MKAFVCALFIVAADVRVEIWISPKLTTPQVMFLRPNTVDVR